MYHIVLPVIRTALSLTGSFFVGVIMIAVLRQVNVINTCQIRVTSNMVIIIAIHIKVNAYVMANFLALWSIRNGFMIYTEHTECTAVKAL